ncbi:MAG: rod shape-determining protein MreD [Flavobacteriaceae bacterium]
MNNHVIKNTVLFIGLVLIQVLILNNINLFEYLNPYIYIVFVIFYPLRKEKGSFLFLSFLLGLTIDFFSNSGGINAAATLFIAYIRLPLLSKILNKTDFDFQTFNIRSISFGKSFSFILILTFIHHFILFGLEYFSFNSFETIFTKTLLSTLFTTVTIFIVIILFAKKN